MKKFFERLHWLAYFIAPAVLGALLFVFHRLLAEFSYRQVVNEIAAIGADQLALSLALCGANYLVLTFYDTASFRYIKNPLEYPRIALTAFVSYTFSHNLGFAAVSGSAIRYRLYSAWRVPPGDIARVIAFSGLNFWLGLFLLGGVSCFTPHASLSIPGLEIHVSLPLLGSILLGIVFSYLLLSFFRHKPFVLRGFRLEIPKPALAIEAVVVACVDWLLAASVLFALLPQSADVHFAMLLSAFFLAQLVGVLSHVPGGLGVFETVVIFLLKDAVPTPTLLGTLLVYRVIYYLLPFTIGALLLLLWELSRSRVERSPRFRPVATLLGGWLANIIPVVLSITTFINGVVLLLSGATPTAHERLHWLRRVVPLAFVEASHFVNSLVGVGLIVLSWAIQKRIDLAYRLTALLLVIGIVVSMLKGFDYEEAGILAVTLLCFMPCHRYFRRPSTLLAERSLRSLMPAALVLLCSVWLGMFSYKHVEYQNSLWWEVAFEGDAPRFLRASVGAALFLLVIGLTRIVGPVTFKPHPPTDDEITAAQSVLSKAYSTTAFLVYTRDKSILFSEDKGAFLMYRTEGRSWVVMGDPVGESGACADLTWRFRELCDLHDAWPVFYEVRADTIPNYLDVGLRLYKLGEEAMVPLDTFSLDGPAGRDFRYVLRKVEKERCTFSLRPADQVPKLLPQLRAVSDEWLAHKSSREKGFSIGFFDEAYLSRFPVVLIERDGGILAFANVWATEDKSELSIDLMRHVADAPNGVMDFLFVKLMQWGKEQGYRQFNLGMAPLSGLESRPLAPLWNKLGGYAFRRGEQFYNFEGLRRYKEKFNPRWDPKYLAAPGGWNLPRILANVATLISRGPGGSTPPREISFDFFFSYYPFFRQS